MKRGIAIALAGLSLSALVVHAVRSDVPPSASVAAMKRFWSANEPTRLLNSSMFVRDRELGIALLRADHEWPLSWDVRLVIDEDVPIGVAEQQLEKSAYVLAPRYVLLERARTSPRRFRLEALVKAR